MTSEPAEPAGPTFFYCFVAFLLLAPLYRAGNRPLPLLLLELAAIGFLFVIVAVHRQPLALPRLLTAAIALLLLYPLLQLVPLPGTLWRMLPGHAEYVSVLERFAAPGAAGMSRALSIIPVKTEYGWLALLPPLACLLAAMRLSTEHVAGLLLIMVGFAGAESLLGLVQVGAGGDFILEPSGDAQRGVASGTFVNKDHLAAMLAMMLPVIVALLLYSLRPGPHRSPHPVATVASEAAAKRLLLFACALSILVCLVFTRSRAGIAFGFVALVASGIVLERARAESRDETHTRVVGIIVTALVALSAVVALVIGAEPVIGGFAPGTLHASAEGRAEFYLATLRAAIDFLPFGSGLSTFADVFPRYQIGDLNVAIDYAHNDYLQAFLELGVVAPLVVGLLLFAYAARMTQLLRDAGGHRFTLLQIGAGLGLLPMILHSLFDFPLRMPANAMWFATLAGILFRGTVGDDEHVSSRWSEIPRKPQNRAPFG